MATKLASFSIITICRNHVDGLIATGASVAAQSCKDYEWIVIDGASTDGTLAYLQSQAANPHLQYISEPDGGIYDAMNKGIERATGDYLLFLNAGDTLADTNVLSAIRNLTDTVPDFIYGDSLEENHYKKARDFSTIIMGMFTHHQAMIYNRAALGHLRYNTAYKIAGDYDLTLRFIRPDTAVAYYKGAVCIFEQGGISQRAVALGRREQYQSRQENKACSWRFNAFIYILQSAAYLLRRYLPKLYWLLKH